MTTNPTGRRQRWARATSMVGVLALAVSLPGCGTRISEERIAAADGSAVLSSQGDVVAPSGGRPTPGDRLPTAGGAAAGAVAGGSVGGSPKPGAAPAGAGSTASGAVPGSGGGAAPTKARTQPGGGGTANPANAACTQSLAPVVLGQTTPASGIIGASTFNMRAGMALWARAVNARGGVQCHPVQLIQMDDAADPARVTSNLTAMKSKGAVAFVGTGVPTTFAAAKQFAEKTKIPFVGGDLAELGWFSSPYFFPQGGYALAAYTGALKEAAAAAKSKRVGLVYCVEASICGVINDNFEAMAKAADLEVVIKKVSSFTAPDYTAECQSLKDAKVDALFVAYDGSGISRFIRSCLSLGYDPSAAVSAISISAETASDPNVRKFGLFVGSGTAPYPATDTAGAADFKAAYDRFAPGSLIDQNMALQWTAGKLFEKALERVYSKARSGPIATDLIYEGLWQLKNETLDGLAPGATFTRNAKPGLSNCYGVLRLGANGFEAPKGSKFGCFSDLPGAF